MTKKEKRLLYVALAIFFAYMLPFELLPLAVEHYRKTRDHIQQLQANIERYQRLEQQTQIWRERHQEVLTQQEQVNAGLLQGSTRDLVAARLQTLLKEAAQRNKLQVQSLDLPEFVAAGDWLLVTQNIRFQAESTELLNFLRTLQENPTFLPIITLDVRGYRGERLSGSIKITGFSAILEA